MVDGDFAVETYIKALGQQDLLDLLVRPPSEDVAMGDVEDLRPSKRKIIYAEVCCRLDFGLYFLFSFMYSIKENMAI